MVWMETCAVDERMRFVMSVVGEEDAFAVVCRRFGEPEDWLQMA